MVRFRFLGFLACFFATFLVFPVLSYSQEKATPQEVIRKVREAASYLKKTGNIDAFKKGNKRWVWKDTYIFVIDCNRVVMVAHPIKPALEGRPLGGLRDAKGDLFFVQLCEVSRNPNGGWVEYWWPKPGEKKASRKITYILHVQGTPYSVGAGVYDNTLTVEELNKLIQQ